MKKLCLGTWQFESTFKRIDLEEARKVIEYARGVGINAFDTALVYENQEIEKLLGSTIAKNSFMITKVPAIKKPMINNMETIESYYPLSNLKIDIEKSHKNLQKIPDVMLLHNWSKAWDNSHSAKKVFTYMKELKNKNYFRYFGVSLPNYYGENISEWLLKEIDFVEVPLNEKNQWILKYLDQVKEFGVRVCVRSLFEAGKFFDLKRENSEVVKRIKEAYKIADYVIIGMTSEKTIDKNIEIFKNEEGREGI